MAQQEWRSLRTQSPRDAILALAERLARSIRDRPRRVDFTLDDDGFTEEERIGGELLDALARELRPALRDAGAALHVGEPPTEFVLTGDGRFLRLEAGSAWPIRSAAVLMRVEVDVRDVLGELEVGLLALDRASCGAAAALVREVHDIVAR